MSTLSAEQEVVLSILRDNGVDTDLLRDAQRDPAFLQTLQSLKLKLAKALIVLSDELYSKPAHFVLEVIQNAADNSYADGCQPELRFVLRSSYMETECNEVGFSADNVRAFCGIGQSTKKNQAGYIGEKGIGAKSMFKVATKVSVHSNGFHFVLDRDRELGMISPQWLANSRGRKGWTTMRLDFCDNRQFATVKTQLEHVRESVLLFMKKLARLTIDDGSAHTFSISRAVDGNLVTITTAHGKVSRRQYIRISQTVPASRNEPKREHVDLTEIVLAFPLNEDGQPLAKAQMVHAFLPMRPYGFTFIIQADFLTAANREDVLSDLQWNKTIRDAVTTVFLSAFREFQQLEYLEFTWPRFLPDSSSVVDSFFAPVTRMIVAALGRAACIKCENGDYRVPSAVRFPSSFSASGESLIPERYLGFRYIATSYPHDVLHKLRQLGVRDMTFSDFLGGLLSMGATITTQEDEWLEDVCALLNTHGFKRSRNQFVLSDARIRQLPLARLPNGTWLRGEMSSTLFFDSRQSRFPAGLGIQVLHSDDTSPERQKLLSRLGVRNVDADIVAGKILELHRASSSFQFDTATLLEHALYMFEKRNELRTKVQPQLLYLRDRGSILVRGDELYMDSARANATPLSDLLQSPARFIHPDYISPTSLASHQKQPWMSWLKSTCGVATAPRLTSGRPAPEFSALIDRLRTSDPSRLLLILREYWDDLESQAGWHSASTFHEHIASIRIRCRNGAVVELRSTYLLSSSVAPFATSDMPQLPVDKPDANWTFLRQLGVSTEVNAVFFLKRLISLSQAHDASLADVSAIYKQLEARFREIPTEIRNAFRDHALFYVDKTWYSRDAVVWDGPIILTRKILLKRSFASLEELFKTYLAIPDAHPTVIADELIHFAQQNSGSDLTKEAQYTLFALLQYGADTIEAIKKGTCTDWTRNLRTTRILPVSVPGTGRVSLIPPTGNFFVPDPSGEFEQLFSSRLPFLTVSASRLVTLQPLLDHLDVSTKRIDKHVTQEILVDDVPLALASEVGICDEDASASYSGRVQYLQRLQHYRRATEPFVRSITVVTVEHIDAVYKIDADLGREPIKQPHGCWVKGNAEGELELFRVSTSSSRSSFRKSTLVSSLARALGLGNVDKALVSAIVFDDEEDVQDLMRESGIRELDPHIAARIPPVFPPPARAEPLLVEPASPGTPRTSSARTSTSPTSPSLSAAQVSGQQSSGPSRKRKSRPARARRSGSGNGLLQGLMEDDKDEEDEDEEGGMDLTTFVNSDVGRQEMHNLSVVAGQIALPRAGTGGSQHALHRPRMGSSRPGSSDLSIDRTASPVRRRPRRTPQQRTEDDRGKQIGFLGEKFVYELLKNILQDDFSYENWTSELRVHAGFQRFDGEELADFQYLDASGLLTQALFAEDPDYVGTRPEYFIEVKSTSGSQAEPFHMKRRQFLQALELTRDANAEGAMEQIYVLFRVSGVGGGSPTLQVYADPHDLLSRGVLRIESDSVEVRMIADQ